MFSTRFHVYIICYMSHCLEGFDMVDTFNLQFAVRRKPCLFVLFQLWKSFLEVSYYCLDLWMYF